MQASFKKANKQKIVSTRVGKKGLVTYLDEGTLDAIKILAAATGEPIHKYVATVLQKHVAEGFSPDKIRELQRLKGEKLALLASSLLHGTSP